ncbi:hypothetical protein EST38_g10058 [Candolleomyces aberdarensis]|uniref:Fungal-type protein kinase domain-containing protein n=1 Tax=Candolleomyces aberdarensis TaxID=2316362 RepID=A0A4Q2DAS3_9AGAR|nr:hypothetical protein EST38_g10058 [Candolleomyces aberdarensis]
MVKALLALKYLRQAEPEKMGAQSGELLRVESSEKARKFAGEQFDVLLEHAVEICNDPQRSDDLKKALQEAILSQFQKTFIGELERVDLITQHPDEFHEKDSTRNRITWADITHCWELEISKTLDKRHLARLGERCLHASKNLEGGRRLKGERLEHFSVSRMDEPEQCSNTRKRPYEDDSEPVSSDSTGGPNNKKRKTEEESCEPNLPSEVQCGLYGLELLRSAWDRTHSMAILLRDNQLSIRWHDCEGCIATSNIDVVAQLPLLVTMILLFQRLENRMRGQAGWTSQAVVDGVEVRYSIPADALSGRGLTGRWLIATTPLVHGPSLPSGLTNGGDVEYTEATLKPSEDLFFKLSWREEVRLDETHIIRMAKGRAKYYFGEHAGDVLNHLPAIRHSESDPRLSTGLIREFLGISENGARVPSFMLSQKLHIVARMWEIIRCIAHRDISYGDLMVRSTNNGAYGVVNDFDLAAIMTPGQKYPTRQGFERTGTKAFMALVLLLADADERIQHRCSHDLESVIWCLVWYVTKGVAGWHEGSFNQVGLVKTGWVDHIKPAVLPARSRLGSEHLWRPLANLVDDWKGRQIQIFYKETLKYSDNANMELIDQKLPYPKRSLGEEQDWMVWRVKEEDIRTEDRLLVETA